MTNYLDCNKINGLLLSLMAEYEIDSKTGERRLKQQPPAPADSPVSADDLARLDGMTREDLVKLIRTVAGAFWGYALMDDIQKADAARLKLYAMGMSATEIHKVVPALDKWFDRTVGRAKQQIELTGKDGEPLSIRLIEAQQRLLKDVTPKPLLIEQVASLTNGKQS